MAKKGTKVDELYLSLGLDLDALDRDFSAASGDINNNVRKLNQDLRMAKIQTQIEVGGFDAAGNSFAKLRAQSQGLQAQMEIQKRIIDQTNQAYKETVAKHGETAKSSLNLQERLLKETATYAALENQLKQTNKSRMDSISKIGDGFGRAFDGLSIPVAAAGAASLKAGMDAIESENLFQESFGGMADSARKWSQQLRSELGLNEYSLRKSAGTFYTMFESMGLPTQKAYELATGLTKLAYDMASFYNIKPEEAFEKLRSGVSGEVEPLRQLGISVHETTVQTYAYAQGIARQGQELTEQQKVLARYATILDQTKRAQGDLARTIDSPVNQMRVMKDEVEQLSIELGQALVPQIQGLMKSVKEVIEVYKGMSDSGKSATIEIIKTGIEVGTVNAGLTGMAWALGLPLPWWAKLATAIGVATKNLTDYIFQQRELEKIKTSQALGQTPDANNAIIRKNPQTGEYEKEIIEADAQIKGRIPIMVKKWAKLTGDELKNVIANESRTIFANLKGDNPSPNLNALRSEQEKQQQRDEENAKKQKMLAEQNAVERKKVEQTLRDDIYKLTHSELEGEINDIDVKVREYKKKYPEIANVVEWAEAAKAKAIAKAKVAQDEALGSFVYSAEKLSAEAQSAFGIDVTIKRYEALKSAIKDYLSELEKIRKAQIDTWGNITELSVTAQAAQSGNIQQIENQMSAVESSQKIANINMLKERFNVIQQMLNSEELGAQQRKELIEQESTTFAEYTKNMANGIKDSMTKIEQLQGKMISSGSAAFDIFDKYFFAGADKNINIQLDKMSAMQQIAQGIRDAWNSTDGHTLEQINQVLSLNEKFGKSGVNLGIGVTVSQVQKAYMNSIGGAASSISTLKQNMNDLVGQASNIGAMAAQNYFSEWSGYINGLKEQMASQLGNIGSLPNIMGGLNSLVNRGAGSITVNGRQFPANVNNQIHISISAPLDTEADVSVMADKVADVVDRRLQNLTGGNSDYAY